MVAPAVSAGLVATVSASVKSVPAGMSGVVQVTTPVPPTVGVVQVTPAVSTLANVVLAGRVTSTVGWVAVWVPPLLMRCWYWIGRPGPIVAGARAATLMPGTNAPIVSTSTWPKWPVGWHRPAITRTSSESPMSTTPGSAAMSISVQSTYCTVAVPTDVRHGTPGWPA